MNAVELFTVIVMIVFGALTVMVNRALPSAIAGMICFVAVCYALSSHYLDWWLPPVAVVVGGFWSGTRMIVKESRKKVTVAPVVRVRTVWPNHKTVDTDGNEVNPFDPRFLLLPRPMVIHTYENPMPGDKRSKR